MSDLGATREGANVYAGISGNNKLESVANLSAGAMQILRCESFLPQKGVLARQRGKAAAEFSISKCNHKSPSPGLSRSTNSEPIICT